MNTQLIADLTALRDLFRDPSKWTQGWFAKDASGADVYFKDQKATCFCLLGGVQLITHPNLSNQRVLLSALISQLPGAVDLTALTAFNDSHTYPEVVDLINRARNKELETLTQLETDLTALRDLLSDPAKWTTGVVARDAHGEKVISSDLTAVCFCLAGGVIKVTAPDEHRRSNLLVYLGKQLPPKYGNQLGPFNDDNDHEGIMAFIELALKNLRAIFA